MELETFVNNGWLTLDSHMGQQRWNLFWFLPTNKFIFAPHSRGYAVTDDSALHKRGEMIFDDYVTD